jgi:hypothetical protein
LCADPDSDLAPDFDSDLDSDPDFDSDLDSDLDSDSDPGPAFDPDLDEWRGSHREGRGGVVLGGAASSAYAPMIQEEEALTARTPQRLSTDTHRAPKPSPLLADHEPVSAAPGSACPPRGPCRRALRMAQAPMSRQFRAGGR